MEDRPLRFCLLDCEDAEKWAGHEELAKNILHPGASWEHYRCYQHQLPDLEGLSERFDGVMISGSHYSAYEDRAWIHELEGWLQQAVAEHPRVKFLGICFGCQMLAKALGGRVGKNPGHTFVLQVEEIILEPRLQGSPALQLASEDVGTGSVSAVRIIQSHGDQVLELPPGGVLLASSRTAPVEIFTVPAGNVLAVQGHAELTAEDTLTKIHPAITAAGRLSADEAKESERSLREDETDAELVLALYRRFMERGLPPLQQVAEQEQQAPEQEQQAPERTVEAEEQVGTAVNATVVDSAGGLSTDDAAGASPGASSSPAMLAEGASGSGPSSASAEAVSQMLQHLQLAVSAELGRGLSEHELVEQCNSIAAERYQQLGDSVLSARQQLQVLGQQHENLAPHMRLLDDLEVQVAGMEAAVAQLDTKSRSLQHCMAGMK